MSNKTLKVGAEIGYAVVSESDLHIDPFGNVQPNSKPIVWESNLNNSMHAAREHAKRLGSYGRRIVCKLVFVEEVFDDNN